MSNNEGAGMSHKEYAEWLKTVVTEAAVAAEKAKGDVGLRDYFAGQALIGADVFAYDGDGAYDFFADAARRAYQLADAMLEEREKE